MIDHTTNLQAAEASLAAERARLDSQAAAIEAERRRRLQAQHRVAIDQARAAKDHPAAAYSAREQAKGTFMRAAGKAEDARNKRAWHAEAKPDVYRYPTESELADWQAKAAELHAAVVEAQREYSQAWADYQAERVAWTQAREDFQRAADREAEARAALNAGRRDGITIEARDGVVGATFVRTA